MIFSGNTTVVVQCFNKPEMTSSVLDSLSLCHYANECSLLIFQDGIFGTQKEKYLQKHEQVKTTILKKKDQLERSFKSVNYHFADDNLGTCSACMHAIDVAFTFSDSVIFTEDDTIFSKDALIWFSFCLDQMKKKSELVAAAGESIFFDAREKETHPEDLSVYKKFASTQRLQAAYTYFSFIPSTCFAVTKDGWSKIGKTRGQARGDEDVCTLVQEQDLSCIFPIISRVADYGMLHPDGYSVSIHGAENVKERKNVFLTADMVPRLDGEWHEFSGDKDNLFRATVKFTKTIDEITVRKSDPLPKSSPFLSTRGAPKLWCFSLKNFGDALTPYIFQKLGIKFELVENFKDAELIGIGSNLDRVVDSKHIRGVWTSGFMYPKMNAIRFPDKVEIFGVRGKETATSIANLPISYSLGDGGLLVNSIFTDRVKPDGKVALIPHMSDKGAKFVQTARNNENFKIIDVFSGIDSILSEVKASRFVLSTSLHGLIVADAFGIPNAFAHFADGREIEGNGYKYKDYITAVGGEMLTIHTEETDQTIKDIEKIMDKYSRPTLLSCIKQLTDSAQRVRNF